MAVLRHEASFSQRLEHHLNEYEHMAIVKDQLLSDIEIKNDSYKSILQFCVSMCAVIFALGVLCFFLF